MANLISFNCFAADFAAGQHILDKDILKMALTAGVYDPEEEIYLPPPLTLTNWNTTDFPEPFGSVSYPAGGYELVVTKYVENDGVYSLFLENLEFVCPDNQFFGPFRYFVIYNTNINNRLIGYYDYTVVKELNPGETFFVDFDPEKIVPAIKVDTNGSSEPPPPSPTPTPTPTPPVSPVGFTFISQTGTGTYSGKGISNSPPVANEPLEITMTSDGSTKYMTFKAERTGTLKYKYKVFDPSKTEATASMTANGFQQGSANRFTGSISGSVAVTIGQTIVLSFNSGYIPVGGTSTATGSFSMYI